MDGPDTVPLFPVAITQWKVTSNARLYEVERNLEAERTDRLQATWSHGKRGHRVQVLVNGGMTRGLQPTSLLHPRDFPGRSTGVGCH